MLSGGASPKIPSPVYMYERLTLKINQKDIRQPYSEKFLGKHAPNPFNLLVQAH